LVLGRLAGWVSWLVPSLTWLNLPAAVQEFADLMTGQVSFKLRNSVADPERFRIPGPYFSIRIPDPNFFYPGSWIRGQKGSKFRFRIRVKEF
jgi:hypothetical protein